MQNIIGILAAVIAVVSAGRYEDLESNLIEYDVPVNVPGISVPYPYQESSIGNRVMQPAYYDAYDTVVVPAVPSEVALSKSGLIATVASYAISLAKTAIAFLMANGAALLLGSLTALGVCKFTPICTKLNDVKSLLDAQREFRSLVTPDRIARATEFVQNAIKKYSSLQENNNH